MFRNSDKAMTIDSTDLVVGDLVRFLPRFLVAAASEFQFGEVLQQFGVWVLK